MAAMSSLVHLAAATCQQSWLLLLLSTAAQCDNNRYALMELTRRSS